jgi:NitT/TauT family transport system ATP-binding protein
MRQRASIRRALLAAQISQDTRKTLPFITHSIAEAVFPSDPVVMMSKSPGMIVDTIVIDLPRSRRLVVRDSAEFGTYVHRIRHYFAELGIVRE